MTSQRVAKALYLEGENRRYFMAMVQYNNERTPRKKDILFAKLMEIKHAVLNNNFDQLALEYFSEWYHPVLRELSRDGSVTTAIEDLSRRLLPRILPKDIESSLHLLSRLGLIEFADDGKVFRYKGENVVPSRRINQHASIRFHHAMMDMAKDALVKIAEQQREYNALTLSLAPSCIPKAKEIIQKTCMELLELENIDQGARDVYQVNIQVFPFTKRG